MTANQNLIIFELAGKKTLIFEYVVPEEGDNPFVNTNINLSKATQWNNIFDTIDNCFVNKIAEDRFAEKKYAEFIAETNSEPISSLEAVILIHDAEGNGCRDITVVKYFVSENKSYVLTKKADFGFEKYTYTTEYVFDLIRDTLLGEINEEAFCRHGVNPWNLDIIDIDNNFAYRLVSDGTVELILKSSQIDGYSIKDTYYIPESIEGKTVTRFSGCSAHGCCFVLPKTVKVCYDWTPRVLFAEDNPFICVESGYLVDKKSKMIVSDPEAPTNHRYQVEDGTVELNELPLSNYDLNTFFYGLNIPSSVKYIDPRALHGYENFIFISEDNPYFTEDKGSIYSKDKKKLIYAGKMEKQGWKRTPQRLSHRFAGNAEEYLIDRSVEEIGSYAFSDVLKRETKTIILPEGLKKIESHAFSGLKISGYIQIPSSCTDIDEKAFDGLLPSSKCVKYQRKNTQHKKASNIKNTSQDPKEKLDSIVEDLKGKYTNKPVPMSLQEFKDENPDVNFSFMQTWAKRLYRMTMYQFLVSNGLAYDYEMDAAEEDHLLVEKITAIIKERYCGQDKSPATSIGQINEECKDIEGYRRCLNKIRELYKLTASEYFTIQGIIQN